MNKDQKNKQVIKNIENFGQFYYDQHLHGLDKDLLSDDWWYALKFFFSKSFMRGRKDELSVKYCSFTIEVLEEYLEIGKNPKEAINKLINSKEFLEAKNFKKLKKELGRKSSRKAAAKDFEDIKKNNPFINILTSEKYVTVKEDCLQDDEGEAKKVFLSNDADIMMVLDTLLFVSMKIPKEYNNNIYLYIKRLLEHNKVGEAYEKIIYEISYMGDKLTTFFIRDIMLMNPEMKFRKCDDYSYAFPVDTWVRKVAEKLGNKSKNENKVKSFFINESERYNKNPLKIAAGVWYLGVNSFDILIDKCLFQDLMDKN